MDNFELFYIVRPVLIIYSIGLFLWVMVFHDLFRHRAGLFARIVLGEIWPCVAIYHLAQLIVWLVMNVWGKDE